MEDLFGFDEMRDMFSPEAVAAMLGGRCPGVGCGQKTRDLRPWPPNAKPAREFLCGACRFKRAAALATGRHQ